MSAVPKLVQCMLGEGESFTASGPVPNFEWDWPESTPESERKVLGAGKWQKSTKQGKYL